MSLPLSKVRPQFAISSVSSGGFHTTVAELGRPGKLYNEQESMKMLQFYL